MFIVIDWIDGSGKGTQLKRVQEALEKMGKSVKVLDFPRYGNPSAFFVEKYLNGAYGMSLWAKQASLFYALDRFDAAQDIKTDIENYDFVISNRYVSASMIHQWGKIVDIAEVDEFLLWLSHLEFDILHIPRPDMTLFLDVPPEISLKLISLKEQRNYIKDGSNTDIHEADPEHLKNAYTRAVYVCEKLSWTKIVCTQDGEIFPLEKITDLILQKILHYETGMR